jgi:hypothetical protein
MGTFFSIDLVPESDLSMDDVAVSTECSVINVDSAFSGSIVVGLK